MATHSSILAWKIPWTEEPEGLQSMKPQSQTRLKQLSAHAHALGIEHRFMPSESNLFSLERSAYFLFLSIYTIIYDLGYEDFLLC